MGPQKRSTGLALIGIGVLVFAGTNAARLPAAAFWPALAICVVGLLVFIKANHVAMERAEQQARRALHPPLRNPTLESFAEKQARTNGRALEELAENERYHRPAEAASSLSASPCVTATETPQEEIVLYEIDEAGQTGDDQEADDFVVASDVSFPVELQQHNALADQLEKLEHLRDQGILSGEEFALAKAKLLR